MKIKVCGVTRENDIEALLSVDIDYIGFNFIKSSPRKVSVDWALNMSRKYNLEDKFTCLLENPTVDDIAKILDTNEQSNFQLYGNYQKPEKSMCFEPLSATNLQQNDLLQIKPIRNTIFLLDNMAGTLGGSGNKFDWSILDNVNLSNFMIAGGVGVEDLDYLSTLQIFGVDLNSKIEISPGIKDLKKLKLLEQFRYE
jgi:phosphoribosylanthranilate isomerase